MKASLACAAFVTLIIALPAFAQQRPDTHLSDGNNLLDKCRTLINIADSLSPEKTPLIEWDKFSWCEGYLQATRDRFVATKVTLGVLGMTGLKFDGPNGIPAAAVNMLDPVCIPDQATVLQLARVVVKWLGDHPERLHEAQSVLIVKALQDAFPCKSEPKP